jgi:phosphate transport system substrate-binding protein
MLSAFFPALMRMIFLVSLLAAASGLGFLTACSQKASVSLVVTGSSTVAPVVAEAAARFEQFHPDVRIDVQTGGSSRGITDVRSGVAALGMISREVTADETGLVAHMIAIDGVGVIVHRDNPISSLNRQQLIDIYTGKITNWISVGGSDSRITLISKAEGRATLEVFLGYTGLDSADIKADVIIGENQQAIKTVAGNPLAIAYVSIGAAASEAGAGTPVKLLSCDGVAATSATVASGSFPITRPLQLVSRGELPPAASAFLDFMMSSQIHDVITSHLYVPVVR